MNHNHILDARLTHGYVTGWRHLDKYEQLGPAKITRERSVMKELPDWEDSEDRIVRRCAVTLAPETLAEAKRLYRSQRKTAGVTFSRWLCGQVGDTFDRGCRCEHDCCGHYQWYGQATRTGRRTFVVYVSGSRNL